MNILKNIGAIVLLLGVSCTTRDGVLESLERKPGSLGVYCNIDSAVVYIDGAKTGVVTVAGDTVLIASVCAGLHTISLQRECYQSDAPGTVTVQSGERIYLVFEMLLLDTVGNLKITSRPDSALVVVDGLERGFTPVRLNCLGAGEHFVDIKKAGYARISQSFMVEGGKTDSIQFALDLKRLVLMEHFSSTSCVPCVAADEDIKRVLTVNGAETIVSINYHTQIPAPGDPMYLFARTDNDARLEYYNVVTSPLVIVDGLFSQYGTSQLAMRLSADIETRKCVVPKAVLEIYNLEKNPLAVKGDLFIEPLTGLNADVMVALVERSVTFPDPPGQNGQTHFFDVLRRFFSTEQGKRPELSAGERVEMSFNFTLQGRDESVKKNT